MKRDMDLVRDILLALEENPQLNGRAIHRGRVEKFFERDGVSDDDAAYQLLLLLDRDLVVGSCNRTSATFDVERLSMDGHDFLNTIRDPEVWKKATDVARKAGASTIDLIWSIGKQIATAEIKRLTGFDV